MATEHQAEHLTDGKWHDDCSACLARREQGAVRPTRGPVLDDVPSPVGHYAGEVWRLASGLAELGIELDPGPIDQAPVSTALSRLEVFRGEDGRPLGTPCSVGQPEDDDGQAEARAEAARTALAQTPKDETGRLVRELAKGVVSVAYTAGVPHTFWHSDTRITLACRVLGLDPDRARETGLDDLAAVSGHDW